MASVIISSQPKLAEKLCILNDRGVGMLTRLYNTKKMLSSPESKPAFLSDRSLEPTIKYIVKKFPEKTSINFNHSAAVDPIKADVIKSLSPYYDTFADIMDFKDHVTDLLTTIDACQVYFDITLNFDLTRAYLDLIVNYVSVMILLARVEDRKAVLGLFNCAHELSSHGKAEASFPRLGRMIVEYDPPVPKLSKEFNTHSKCLVQALLSLQLVYPRKALKTENWSLLSDPSILATNQIDTMTCEYLSLATIERWIIFGFMLCHQQLQDPDAWELWKQVLHGGYIICLCRDEVMHTHLFIMNYFESIKGYSKRVKEIGDLYQQAVTNTPRVHKEKREFLRRTIKELAIVLTDQPGLLGPKALYVFIALSLARDEIHWLLHHYNNPPPKKAGVRWQSDEFVDRQIPQLMFHLEELRALVKKYSQVMQRYFVQYLAGYDAVVLSQLIQTLSSHLEDESVILSSFYHTMASLSNKQVEKNESLDFHGFRLDWFRLQAYSSVGKAGLQLRDHKDLAKHMNTVIFHTRMVDCLDEMLFITSDLSIYCFYTSIFEQQFNQCIEYPSQHRYSIAFPMMCAHFTSATHEICPEERHSIGTTSIKLAAYFLNEMCITANAVIKHICEDQCALAEKVLPKHCVAQIVNASVNKRKTRTMQEPEKPGQESFRKRREQFTRMDKLHMALTEMCCAINYCSVITVWDYGFVPRDFLIQQLETRFNKILIEKMNYNGESGEIAKPSQMLGSVKAVMNVLQSIENYVHVDISRVFNNVLPQQTQPTDSFSGEKTITSNYTQWYLEAILKRVSQGHCVYSPDRKAFLSLTPEGQPASNVGEFANLMELRALAELIGPYGMRHLSERLMLNISTQVEELKKLVTQNKEILSSLRTSFDKPDQMKELQKKLINADSVLQKMTIIGVLLSFHALAQEALLDVLNERMPFLLSSIKDFQQHMPNGQDPMIVNEMASAAGLPCDIDPALYNILCSHKTGRSEEDYRVACLLMVFLAATIPRLAKSDYTFCKASLEGHVNSILCLAKAINSLAGALFTIHKPVDVEERLKEFLTLASSSLLRLGQETDKESTKNKESVYLLLDEIVQESPFLTMDVLESCFPYALLRTSYQHLYKYIDTQ